MTKKVVKQRSRNNSQNIQLNEVCETKNVVNNYGLTYIDAKNIALDVYKAEEAKKYTDEASKTALLRVENLVLSFLKEVFNDNPDKTINLKKPAVQKSILSAEKGFATDETGLTKEYYIELLKSRICSDEKSFIQIFEDEAIDLVGKLTRIQMNYLSFMYLTLSYPKPLNNIDNLVDFCNKLCDLYDESFNKYFQIISLDSIGACSPLGGARNIKPIQTRLHEKFPGMFYKEQTIDEMLDYLGIDDIDIIKPIIIKSVWNDKKYQINALNINTLKDHIIKYKLNMYEEKLINMFTNQLMNESEIKDKLSCVNEKMKDILKFWDDSEYNSRRLTPQGEIIAIINYNIIYNESIDYRNLFE